MMGLIGKKIGMSQIFGQDGKLVCVSVVEAGPCVVLAIKDKKIQLGFDDAKEKQLKKPQVGLFKKLNISPKKIIREFSKDTGEYQVGQVLTSEFFKPGEFVDVTGTSIGKGFAGGMKRWGWKGGPRTHGSTSHRRVGSIGSTTTPGRVIKGHHMPGHMGNKQSTVQNLEVVKVLADKNLICLKGAIPGFKNNYIFIKKAKKKQVKVK